MFYPLSIIGMQIKKTSHDNRTEGAHYLSWKQTRFEINDSWGGEDDFRALLESDSDLVTVKLKSLGNLRNVS